MPRICAEDLLGPLEPFVLVPVFHHPFGDLESRIEVARVLQHRVPELNDLVVLFPQAGRLSSSFFAWSASPAILSAWAYE